MSKWIRHRYTCVPHPEPSSLLPPHTIPLGCPSAPAPSIQYRTSNLDWWHYKFSWNYLHMKIIEKIFFKISLELLKDANQVSDTVILKNSAKEKSWEFKATSFFYINVLLFFFYFLNKKYFSLLLMFYFICT